MNNPRVYLAGPEVFLPSPMAIAERKKALCDTYGFTGVFPLDGGLDLTGLSPRQAALAISRANEDLIRGSHAVIANITSFRGPSADVGTAYEMGAARAIGLPIFAYSNVSKTFGERTKAFAGKTRPRPDGTLEDEEGIMIEEFGLMDNVMLEGAISDSGGSLAVFDAPPERRYTDLTAFETCLKAARKLFAATRPG